MSQNRFPTPLGAGAAGAQAQAGMNYQTAQPGPSIPQLLLSQQQSILQLLQNAQIAQNAIKPRHEEIIRENQRLQHEIQQLRASERATQLQTQASFAQLSSQLQAERDRNQKLTTELDQERARHSEEKARPQQKYQTVQPASLPATGAAVEKSTQQDSESSSQSEQSDDASDPEYKPKKGTKRKSSESDSEYSDAKPAKKKIKRTRGKLTLPTHVFNFMLKPHVNFGTKFVGTCGEKWRELKTNQQQLFRNAGLQVTQKKEKGTHKTTAMYETIALDDELHQVILSVVNKLPKDQRSGAKKIAYLEYKGSRGATSDTASDTFAGAGAGAYTDTSRATNAASASEHHVSGADGDVIMQPAATSTDASLLISTATSHASSQALVLQRLSINVPPRPQPPARQFAGYSSASFAGAAAAASTGYYNPSPGYLGSSFMSPSAPALFSMSASQLVTSDATMNPVAAPDEQPLSPSTLEWFAKPR